MSVSFAGIELLHDAGETLWDWTRLNVSGEWVHDVPKRETLFGPWPRVEPVIPGKLLWPVGASRHALGYYVVDGQTLVRIRRAVMPGGVRRAGTLAYELVGRTLSCEMFPLPARPLQFSKGQSWHLLPLVDARYFWWEIAADEIEVNPGTTTWAALFASIGEALGVSIEVDAIPAAYLKPAASLGGAYPSLPLLLDACCHAVGCRFVRQFDGSCRVWRVENSLANQREQIRVLESDRLAGGTYSLTSLPLIDPGRPRPSCCAHVPGAGFL